MNAIEIFKETWQEYIARRKLERTPTVTITRFPDGTLWTTTFFPDGTVWVDELVVRRDS